MSSSLPDVSLLNAGDSGSDNGNLPCDGEVSSDFPRSGMNGDTPQPDLTTSGGIFVGRRDGGTMRGPNWNVQGQESGSQPAGAKNRISA